MSDATDADTIDEPSSAAPPPADASPVDTPDAEPEPADELDLDAIEADLDGVERALARLADGSYWTDEVTGQPLPDDLLAADPIARRDVSAPR